MTKIVKISLVFLGLFLTFRALPAEAQYYPFYYQPQPCCLSYAWHDPLTTLSYAPFYGGYPQSYGWNQPYLGNGFGNNFGGWGYPGFSYGNGGYFNLGASFGFGW